MREWMLIDAHAIFAITPLVPDGELEPNGAWGYLRWGARPPTAVFASVSELGKLTRKALMKVKVLEE